MNWRFRFVTLSFVLLFLAIMGRLFYWQVVRAEELSQLGEEQYGRRVVQAPQRGEILTSDGYAIATSKVSYLVFANPKEIKNKGIVTNLLTPLLQTDPVSSSAQLALDRYWVPLKSQVDFQTKDAIEKLEIKGVGFEEHYVRYYPEASTAAKLLGFVGRNDHGEEEGYFGLEGYYDRQLQGKAGKTIQILDALGRPILARMDSGTAKSDGRSFKLYTDRTVQFIVERELKKGIEKYGAEGGMAAIMDPKTGGIIAMASFPTFDPRSYHEYATDLYRNPFISDTYEPGSTFKPLVLASALEDGLVTADTRCDTCSGPVPIGGYEIKTWNDKYHANLSMVDVIKYSDNTGMVFISQKLGLKGMLKTYDRFGIGQITGVDLQGEVPAQIREEDSWYPIDVATASFGQGISLTPITLLSAFSAIANEGVRMQPHVVEEIHTPEGDVIKMRPEELGRPISAKTAKIMTEILVNAVSNGEAKWAKPKGYRIAGKTGTAQIPIAGRYDANKTIPSFIGFAPADDPKFIMLVIYDRPTTSIYGSETAAPTFFAIARQLLTYYGIPPSE